MIQTATRSRLHQLNNLNNFNSHQNIRSIHRASFDPTNTNHQQHSNTTSNDIEYRHSIDIHQLDQIQQEIQQQYEQAKAQQEQQWRELYNNLDSNQVIHNQNNNMHSDDEQYQMLSPINEYQRINQNSNNNLNHNHNERERGHRIQRQISQQRLTDVSTDLIINPCIALSSFRHKQTTRIPHKIKGETYALYPWLQPIKQLGQGAYAGVIEVRDDRNDCSYAIKKNRNVFSNMGDARRMLREIKLMRHMNHENMFSEIRLFFFN